MKDLNRIPPQAEIENTALSLIDQFGDDAPHVAWEMASQEVNELDTGSFNLYYEVAQVLSNVGYSVMSH